MPNRTRPCPPLSRLWGLPPRRLRKKVTRELSTSTCAAEAGSAVMTMTVQPTWLRTASRSRPAWRRRQAQEQCSRWRGVLRSQRTKGVSTIAWQNMRQEILRYLLEPTLMFQAGMTALLATEQKSASQASPGERESLKLRTCSSWASSWSMPQWVANSSGPRLNPELSTAYLNFETRSQSIMSLTTLEQDQLKSLLELTPAQPPSSATLRLVDQLLGIPQRTLPRLARQSLPKKVPPAAQPRPIESSLLKEETVQLGPHKLSRFLQMQRNQTSAPAGDRLNQIAQLFPQLRRGVTGPTTLSLVPVLFPRDFPRTRVGRLEHALLLGGSVLQVPECVLFGSSRGALIIWSKGLNQPILLEDDYRKPITSLAGSQTYVLSTNGEQAICYSLRARGLIPFKSMSFSARAIRSSQFFPELPKCLIGEASGRLSVFSVEKSLLFSNLRKEQFQFGEELLSCFPLSLKEGGTSLAMGLVLLQSRLVVQVVHPATGLAGSVSLPWTASTGRISHFSGNVVFVGYDNALQMVRLDGLSLFPLKVQCTRLKAFVGSQPLLHLQAVTKEQLLVFDSQGPRLLSTYQLRGQPPEPEEQIAGQGMLRVGVAPGWGKQAGQTVVLQGEQARVLEQLSLEDYAGRMIEEGNFRQLLQQLLTVHQGGNYSFSFAHEQASYQKLFGKVLLEYCGSILKLGQKDLRARLGWVLSFLLATDCTSLFRSLLLPLVKQHNHLPCLYDCLEFHILGQGFPLCQELFANLLSYYRDSNRQQVLLALFQPRNLPPGALHSIIPLLSQLGLHSLELRVLTAELAQADFATPFVRLFSKFKTAQEQQARFRLGNLCLLYLEQGLSARMVDGRALAVQQHLAFLKFVLTDVLSQSFLSDLLNFDLTSCLQVLLMPFQKPNYQFILEEGKGLVLQKLKRMSHKQVDLFGDQVLERMACKVVGGSAPLDKSPQFALFQLHLDSLANVLSYERRVKIIAQLISRPQPVSLTLLSQKVLITPERFLLPLIRKCFSYLRHNTQARQELLAQCPSQQTVLRAYLLGAGGRQLPALQLFLQQKSKQVFQFLNLLLLDKRDTAQDESQVVTLFRGRAQQLSSLDPTAISALITQLRLPILQAIQAMPQEQRFLVLEAKVGSKQFADQTLTRPKKETLLAYLGLMAQLHPERVAGTLENGQYPLDQAIAICSNSRNLEGLLVLRQKEGAYREVTRLCFRIIDDRARRQDRAAQCNLWLGRALRSLRDRALQPNQYEKQWRLIVEECVARRRKAPSLSRVLEQFVEKAFEEGMRYLPRESILEFLYQQSKRLGLRVMKRLWLSMFQALSLDIQKHTFVLALLAQTRAKTLADLSQHRQAAVLTANCCCYCLAPLQGAAPVLQFTCGHSFHCSCLMGQQDCICCKNPDLARALYGAEPEQSKACRSSLQVRRQSGSKETEGKEGKERQRRVGRRLKEWDFRCEM